MEVIEHMDEPNQTATYRAGRHLWLVEGQSVVVSCDGNSPLPCTTGAYTYKDFESACDAAWLMANRQLRA